MPDDPLAHKILKSIGMSRQKRCLTVPSSGTRPRGGSHPYPQQQEGGSQLSHHTGKGPSGSEPFSTSCPHEWGGGQGQATRLTSTEATLPLPTP